MANINGTLATDFLSGTINGDSINARGGDDGVNGNEGNDTILGGDGDDGLRGDDGDDLLQGGADFDNLTGGSGNDTLDGGDTANPGEFDRDTANYRNEGGGGAVVVDLVLGTATDTFGNTDTLIDIERVFGTDQGDSVTGGNTNNDDFELYRVGDGSDTITDTSGFDIAGYERDASWGGGAGIVANLNLGTVRDGFGAIDHISGIEGIRGTIVSDELRGNSLGNWFEPLGGTDYINGGNGNDTVAYNGDTYFTDTQQSDSGLFGIDADLLLGRVIDTSGLIDTVVSIENIYGSSHDDEIRGNGLGNILKGFDGADFLGGRGGADDLSGEKGNDHLRGGNGADTLNGGLGDDVLVGGAGADRYVIGVDNDYDTVRGFKTGTDKIDVTEFGFASGAAVLALGTETRAGVVFELSDDVTLELYGIALSDVAASDFLV